MPKPPLGLEVKAQIEAAVSSIIAPEARSTQVFPAKSLQVLEERSLHSVSDLKISRSASRPTAAKDRAAFGFLSQLERRRRKPPDCVPCACEGCPNEAVHIDANGTGFCLAHFEEE